MPSREGFQNSAVVEAQDVYRHGDQRIDGHGGAGGRPRRGSAHGSRTGARRPAPGVAFRLLRGGFATDDERGGVMAAARGLGPRPLGVRGFESHPPHLLL